MDQVTSNFTHVFDVATPLMDAFAGCFRGNALYVVAPGGIRGYDVTSGEQRFALDASYCRYRFISPFQSGLVLGLENGDVYYVDIESASRIVFRRFAQLGGSIIDCKMGHGSLYVLSHHVVDYRLSRVTPAVESRPGNLIQRPLEHFEGSGGTLAIAEDQVFVIGDTGFLHGYALADLEGPLIAHRTPAAAYDAAIIAEGRILLKPESNAFLTCGDLNSGVFWERELDCHSRRLISYPAFDGTHCFVGLASESDPYVLALIDAATGVIERTVPLYAPPAFAQSAPIQVKNGLAYIFGESSLIALNMFTGKQYYIWLSTDARPIPVGGFRRSALYYYYHATGVTSRTAHVAAIRLTPRSVSTSARPNSVDASENRRSACVGEIVGFIRSAARQE